MSELNREVENLAFAEAEKFKLASQTRLHDIEVDDKVFNINLQEFLVQNRIDADTNIEGIKDLLKRAFLYFHDIGVDAALQMHFSDEVYVKYDNDKLVNLIDPEFPTSILNHINNLGLAQISDAIYNEVFNRNQNLSISIGDAIESMLYSAFKLGVELINQIPIKNSDFDLSIIDIENERESYLEAIDDMLHVVCPFCEKSVFSVPKNHTYNRLIQFDNCNHIYVQYHQGIDQHINMQENTRNMLADVVRDMISEKGISFGSKLHVTNLERNYTIDDFLIDLYTNTVFTKIEEEEFVARYRELCSNYSIKISVEDIHGEVVMTYFQSEKY